ncbi:MAG: hypothetical protein ACI9EW_003173, partial [Cellvibrionaceae bacterium]
SGRDIHINMLAIDRLFMRMPSPYIWGQPPEFPKSRNCLVSSVMEDISNEVFGIIARVSFDLEESEGHVRTGGVELAPYHEHDKVVPIELKAVLNIVSQQRVEDLIPVDGSHVHFDPSRLDPNNLMSHRHD